MIPGAEKNTARSKCRLRKILPLVEKKLSAAENKIPLSSSFAEEKIFRALKHCVL